MPPKPSYIKTISTNSEVHIKADGDNPYVKKIYIDDDAEIAAFRKKNEVRCLKVLGWFKNEGVTEKGRPYVEMTYLSGKPLSFLYTFVGNEIGFPPLFQNSIKLTRLFISVAEQIKTLHDNNIIHADIKPGNLMLDIDGDQLTLYDFDLSLQVTDKKPTVRMVPACWGTPAYMSPEVIHTGIISKSADIYAFAATIKEICLYLELFDSALARTSQLILDIYESMSIEETLTQLKNLQENELKRTDIQPALDHINPRRLWSPFRTRHLYHNATPRGRMIEAQREMLRKLYDDLFSMIDKVEVSYDQLKTLSLDKLESTIEQYLVEYIFSQKHKNDRKLEEHHLETHLSALLRSFRDLPSSQERHQPLMDRITASQSYHSYQQNYPNHASHIKRQLDMALGLAIFQPIVVSRPKKFCCVMQ